MLRVSARQGHRVALAGLIAFAGITACSGGGGSSTQPAAGPPLGGAGSIIAFNQHVNFTVIVPPVATMGAVAAARRKARGATTTNPYVSPKTASVSLQDELVNGAAPRTLPAPVVINITCTGTDGCSVPIQNVPAAAGVNRFSVTTFSGPGGSGNVISTGFVDVTAPSAQASSFGGTKLTIGGIVQSILLVVNQPRPGFTWNVPSTGTVDVNALDPAGAIIIGSDLLASPIVVSLPQTNEGAFAFSAQPNPLQATFQQPAQSVALAYGGENINSGTVSAQTADQTVATSVPVPISLPTQATPPPPPPQKKPLSLYVYDGQADRVIEYANINAVEGGQPFGSPRRIFEVAAPSPAVTCPPPGGAPPAIFNMDVGATSGTIYLQTQCFDATGTQNYVFVYSASTQEVVPPHGSPTPPLPTSTFYVVPPTATGNGIKVDEAHGNVYLQYQNSFSAGSNIIGVSLANPTRTVTNFGASCLIELGQTPPCSTDTNNYYVSGNQLNFAIDANDDVYTVNAYNPTGPNFSNVLPPGPLTESFVNEPAVLVFPPNIPNPEPAPTPFSALAGFHDELGSPNLGSLAIEGSTLYVLTNDVSEIPAPGDLTATNAFWPGLSSCNPQPDQPNVNCADTSTSSQNGHVYLAAFPNATANLTAPSASGLDIVTPPAIMLGGDQAGHFGLGSNNTPGDLLAVRDGFAFVLNPQPEGGSPLPAEVDVYDLNSSFFVNVQPISVSVQPITRLIFDPTQIQPTAIAIGPTGTGVGGESLLRRPARAHHNLRAYAQLLKQRRKALQQRWRALHPIPVSPP